MLDAVVCKEIAANLLSYGFFIIIVLVSGLILTGLFVIARDYKGHLACCQLICSKPREQIAILPPHPVSVFAKDMDDSLSRSFEIETIEVDAKTGKSLTNPVFAFFCPLASSPSSVMT